MADINITNENVEIQEIEVNNVPDQEIIVEQEEIQGIDIEQDENQEIEIEDSQCSGGIELSEPCPLKSEIEASINSKVPQKLGKKLPIADKLYRMDRVYLEGNDGDTPTYVTLAQLLSFFADGGVDGSGSADLVRGISSIELTSSEGLVDTYTIYYTDGSEKLFEITNGKDGKDGEIIYITHITTSTEDDGYNYINFNDGNTLTVKNGSRGARGVPGRNGATGPRGEKGEKGDAYTLTEDDKAEIAELVGGGSTDNVVANYNVVVEYDTTVVDMINTIQEMGADITVFNVVNLYGYQSATLGMQINHYGGNVYNIHAINLMTGKTMQNTNDWTSVLIGEFLVKFKDENTESESTNGLEMPQIRFTSATYTNIDKTVNADNPLTLTVEIVGGGALQVGDILQICAKRTYGYKKADMTPYRKQKLRQQCQYDITEEDLDKRFISVSTDDLVGSWLFKNDRNSVVDMEIDTFSPFYLRIKRPIYKEVDGENTKVDAKFSNVITVWKTYNYSTGEVSIK